MTNEKVTFEDMNFEQELLDGLDAMNFLEPTPIQAQAIPKILSGKDLIACAQTGTGKTAAYILPVLNQLLKSPSGKVRAMVIAPTRELVLQIDKQVEGFAYFLPVSSIPVYGGGDGQTWEQQRKAFEQGADLVIGTPGRLIAHINSKIADLSELEFLILDEADRMLDMGFVEDIMRIIKELPQTRQSLLFSATMPPKIRELSKRILNDPEEVNIAISKPAANIVQQAYLAYDNQKEDLLLKVLQGGNFSSAIIFTSTKDKARSLERAMRKKDVNVEAIHSDLEQHEREKVMLAFRNKKLNFLIGTDIISRGIDVDGIELVVNYDVPPDPEDYIHRIGRTARAEKNGIAITFISDKDQREFQRIEQLIEKEIPKFNVPPKMGDSPAFNPGKGGGSRGGGGRKPFKGKRSGGGGRRR